MKPDPNKETIAQAAERLTIELGLNVTSDCVREWRKKGFDLSDTDSLMAKLRNQKRMPKKIKIQIDDSESDDDESNQDPQDFPDILADQIPDEIKKLESKLIGARDYVEARTVSTQLTGLKNAFRLHVEMGQYVTRESQEREGLHAGQVIKQMIMRIPSELPQALVGLEYPDAVKKCDEFAYSMLLEMSELGKLLDDRPAQ